MIRLAARSAALSLAAVLLATAAPAQQAQQPPRAAASVPESHLAAARELVGLTGITTIFDSFLPQFGAQIRQNLVTRPELTKDLDQVLEGLKPELEKQKQTMVDLTARYYATTFTEPELKELVAFFKAPAGRKYLQSTPTILDALAVETQRWTANVAEFVQTRVRAEMAKRGHQL
jgi:uncharacterized protein